MEKGLVTIFVTVYNIGEHLERFFDCLDKQTFSDYKLLMIDDGSTDNSLSICRAHAEKDSRIEVVPIEHVGIAAARNKILGMLDTEFATSLDGDDYFEPDYLKHLMDAQKKYDADYVISNVIYVTPEGGEYSRFSPREEAFFTKEQFPDILPALLEEERLNYLCTISIIIITFTSISPIPSSIINLWIYCSNSWLIYFRFINNFRFINFN